MENKELTTVVFDLYRYYLNHKESRVRTKDKTKDNYFSIIRVHESEVCLFICLLFVCLNQEIEDNSK